MSTSFFFLLAKITIGSVQTCNGEGMQLLEKMVKGVKVYQVVEATGASLR